MEIIRNSIGWENENGEQLAFDKEHSFMNVARHPDQQRPIWRELTEKEIKQIYNNGKSIVKVQER